MGLVYFIQCETGPVKIGWATDLSRRIIGVRTSCPYEIKLLAAIIAPRAAEKRLHAFFQEHRIHHEWFRPADALFEFIARAKIDGFPLWATERGMPADRSELASELSEIIKRSAEPILPGEKVNAQIIRASHRLRISFENAWNCWYGKGGRRVYPIVKRGYADLQNGRAPQ